MVLKQNNTTKIFLRYRNQIKGSAILHLVKLLCRGQSKLNKITDELKDIFGITSQEIE